MEEEARIILRGAVSHGKPHFRNLTGECFASLGRCRAGTPAARARCANLPIFPEQRPRMYVIDTNVASNRHP